MNRPRYELEPSGHEMVVFDHKTGSRVAHSFTTEREFVQELVRLANAGAALESEPGDRKSTRLNSSHRL